MSYLITGKKHLMSLYYVSDITHMLSLLLRAHTPDAAREGRWERPARTNESSALKPYKSYSKVKIKMMKTQIISPSK